MWHIVMQEETVGFGEKQPVKCKHVKGFKGKDKKTGLPKSGPMRYPYLRIVMRNDQGGEIWLAWYNSTGDTLAMKNPGTFAFRWPTKMAYPKFKDRWGREHEDTLSPMVETEVVEPKRYECHSRFFEDVTERFGQVLATEIAGLFADRLVELITKKAKAKAKAKKAA